MVDNAWNAVHTIIHLGAGRGTNVERYRATGAKRIILVEPDPLSAAELHRITAGDDRCEVIERAVTDADGWVTFHVYNLRQCSSLRSATGLRTLFPGLRTTDDLEVEAVRPEELLAGYLENEAGLTWLIVDVPGEEWAILNRLAEAEVLQRCALLTVSCGTEALYEDAPALEAVLQSLDEWGYEPVAESTEEDPDRPAVTFRFNPHKLAAARLEEQLRDLKIEHKAAKQHAAERGAEAERLAAESTEQRNRIGELEAQLREAQDTRDALTKQVGEQKQTITEQEQKLAELRTRLSLSSAEMVRAEGQIDLIRDLLLRDGGL